MKPIKGMDRAELEKELGRLRREIEHFQNLAGLTLPRQDSFPQLPGIDYYVRSQPLQGKVSGDLAITINFHEHNLAKKIERALEQNNQQLAAALSKNLDRFGILIADVAGHRITDSTMGVYLYAAFKMGIGYELEQHGEITPRLFEKLNTRLYNIVSHSTMASPPFVTMIYGEVANDGRVRDLLAGHPPPLVFSNENNRLEKLDGKYTAASTFLGVLPSRYHHDIEHFEPTFGTKDHYAVNEIALLGQGDIMLLYTDGLTEQKKGAMNFAGTGLEPLLQEVKAEKAKTIYQAIMKELRRHSDDDVTIAVIKKK